jgi:NTE family protein
MHGAYSQNKVGLVLGGGGARGLAHIGVLKVLVREAIPIDFIAGTSMGGIIGGAFAAGQPVEAIEELANKIATLRQQIKLVDLKLTGKGLVRGTRVYRLFASMIGEELTFDQLQIPTAMVAVDIATGREVILNEGKVVDAIRATMSVPGVFEPVQRGDLLLVDGGVLNNVPVDVACRAGCQATIAVDVLPNYPQNQPGLPPVVQPIITPLLPQSFQDLSHILMIMLSELTETRLKACPPGVILRPELPNDVSLLTGFERVKVLIEAGQACAEAALPKIHSVVQSTLQSKGNHPLGDNHHDEPN